ncbi:MAG TPA: DUF5994 family protein [Mycobacterium sp.]|jgi:hypothetical protein|nr:DUF5994 family protein [Mycobacterium sp.]
MTTNSPIAAVPFNADSDRLDDDGAPMWTAKPPDHDVRLVWAPSHNHRSSLAGVWWPRTRDAATELHALLPAVTDRVGGPVTRVSLNIGAWKGDQPRRLHVGETLVKLGWFNTMNPATLSVGRHGQDRLIVAVIPVDTDASAAGELLHRLATNAWPDNVEVALEALQPGNRAEQPTWGK